MKPKAGSLKRSTKTKTNKKKKPGKPLAMLNKKKSKKTQSSKIKNKRQVGHHYWAHKH